MTSRRILAGVVGAALLVAACSDEVSSPTTTTVASTTTTSTTVAPTTTRAATTTAATTTSSSTSTSTTIPVVRGLQLSARGLGDALFGADADGVVSYVASILGAATSDTGWVAPTSVGAACPGTEVRFVTWHDLTLFFSDDSPAATGIRHFAAFQYGEAFGPVIDPFGLATAEGIGVGDSVSDLLTAYPAAVVNPGDELSGPSFFITEGLSGFLDGAEAINVTTSFVGGFGCGE